MPGIANTLFSLVLLLGAQAAEFPADPYKPQVSDEVRALMAMRAQLPSDELIARLETLATGGDDSAAELLGEIRQGGLLGYARQPKIACDYFARLEGRRPDALHNLATCFYDGDGRPKDLARAREMYREAGRGGWLMAQCAYGNMLVRGQGGSADIEQGIAICRHAAELGDKNAQADMGTYLLTGQYIPRDPVEAREWLLRAGAQGQANAAFLLGQIYRKGDGTAKDFDEARKWFVAAHKAGRPDAAFWVLALTVSAAMHEVDGKEVLDPAAHDEIAKWSMQVMERDPDPGKRQQAADMLNALKAR